MVKKLILIGLVFTTDFLWLTNMLFKCSSIVCFIPKEVTVRSQLSLDLAKVTAKPMNVAFVIIKAAY